MLSDGHSARLGIGASPRPSTDAPENLTSRLSRNQVNRRCMPMIGNRPVVTACIADCSQFGHWEAISRSSGGSSGKPMSPCSWSARAATQCGSERQSPRTADESTGSSMPSRLYRPLPGRASPSTAVPGFAASRLWKMGSAPGAGSAARTHRGRKAWSRTQQAHPPLHARRHRSLRRRMA